MLKTIFGSVSACAAMLAVAAPASALLVASGGGVLTADNPQQTGRINRDGVASTWETPKPFSQFNSVSYFYDNVSISFPANAAQDIFYEITFDGVEDAANILTVAYANDFNALDIGENYLGDAGLSTGSPPASQSFQVIVNAGGSLLLNFIDTNNGAFSYTYSVEAFSDADRNEDFGPVDVPAPAALGLLGLGLLGLGIARRRR